MTWLSALSGKIAALGWRRLPEACVRSARFRLARKISAFYRNYLLSSRLLAWIFKFRSPPILLLSYPRSGSSWIAKMLSLSPDVAYLREPIHQAFQARYQVPALMDPDSERPTLCCHRRFNPAMLDFYLRCADNAFRGIVPREPAEVLDNKDDFRFLGRGRKSLLIKEINPLMAAHFHLRYSPRTVLILRHPAAVADSFRRMGWIEGDFETFGFLYGLHLKEAIENTGEGWSLVVEYEAFARAPAENFSSLFASLGLREPTDFTGIIETYCTRSESPDHPYDIRRASMHEADKWQRNLSAEQIEAVMRGYLRSGLAHYRQPTALHDALAARPAGLMDKTAQEDLLLP